MEANAARLEKIRKGEKAIIGTTLYPLKAERPVETLPAERRRGPDDGAVFCQPLPPLRLDEMLEVKP